MKINIIEEQQLKMIEKESYLKEAIRLARERGTKKAEEDFEKNRR